MKNILETADRLFIRDGNIAPIYRYLALIIGVALVLIDIKIWDTGWVFHLGLVVAAVGGYSARASQLNIRPFERAPYPAGWLADRNGGRARGKDEQA
ncbi:hypothetical protein WJ966_24245 [Achromobacter xylosoxidans]